MFSIASIPQKLSAPFGLLGDEAKLSFRSQPTGVAKLATVRVRTLIVEPLMITLNKIPNCRIYRKVTATGIK